MSETREPTSGPLSRLNGEVVDSIAQAKGWTSVDQIISGLGLGSRAAYYRYLSGLNEPSLTRARRIAARAGLPLDVVFPPAPTKAA